MSTPLPTEEDVLAHLVLHAARPITTDVDSTAQTMERIAWNAAMAERPDERFRGDAVAVVAMERLLAMGTVEVAIADSERRWEVERARDAVLLAALEWRDTPTRLASEGLETAIDSLLHAEAEVR